MSERETQYCPICDETVTPSSRYRNYVCEDCTEKAVDSEGRTVTFGNTSLLGHGCQGMYKETGERYDSNICFIDGIKCKAEEAYFGGVVIQPAEH